MRRAASPCWRPAGPKRQRARSGVPSRPSPTTPWRTTSTAAPAYELGRKQDAVPLLRRAADLAPDDVGFLGPLSTLLRGPRHEGRRLKRPRARPWRDANGNWRRQPDLAVAAFQGACALAILGEHERALAWAKRALAIEPDDHQTLYNVACYLFAPRTVRRSGRTCSSERCLERPPIESPGCSRTAISTRFASIRAMSLFCAGSAARA